MRKPAVWLVVGARPNFVKAAPVWRALRAEPALEVRIVHAGQHYDERLSSLFFRDLELPDPDFHLDVGSGTHAEQTAEVMRRLEPLLASERPDVVVVFGDVNSTLAASLTAVKLGIPVAHVEAGLRSFDRSMPEEINRKVTDAVSDLLFVTEDSGRRNLANEGIDRDRVHAVGNPMIDSLERTLPRALARRDALYREFDLERARYGVLTLHRPANVDEKGPLKRLLVALDELARDLPLIFPVHPRTRAVLDEIGETSWKGLRLTDALGYVDFLSLLSGARLVLTDSGGVQEETTALGVACLTLRESTERPVTVEQGSNRLVGRDPERAVTEARKILAGDQPAGTVRPPLWDARSGERIKSFLVEWLQPSRGDSSTGGHHRPAPRSDEPT